MKIGFIGAGNMASAIIKGYLKNATAEICVCDKDQSKVTALVELGTAANKTVTSVATIGELSAMCDYLFLAVKPQNFEEVLSEVKGNIRKKTVVVSIAAGITAAYIKKALAYDAKVVLVMPNTPLLLGYGASALSRVEPTTEEEFAFCCDIFQSSGKIAVISPDQMSEVIPLNGSSPAFIYQYAKHFVEYGVSQGFSEETALALFSQTLIGAAHMMTDSGYDLDQLIQMVSSKGGTTIAGLEALREKGLGEAVQDACERCTKRAYELAK